jgi:bifunctional oligoribonuclease and PAP phosphatase NrnA
MNGTFNQLVPAIDNAGTIMLCTHIHPDGDAIGSLLGLGHILLGLGKAVTMISSDGIPSRFQFLPLSQAVATPGMLDKNMAYDLAIALDAADVNRLGEAYRWFAQSKVTAQIDHHETNPGYAAINIIDGKASSTGNLVLRLAEDLHAGMTKECALCLYASISTDTGNFCFENVHADTFIDMSKLMAAGLEIGAAARTLHLVRSRAHIQLLGRALKSLRFLANGQVSFMNLTDHDYLDSEAAREHSDGIVNYGLDIDGVKIACLADETGTGTKFSLRALPPYSVSQIARSFGGGGHDLAAGCTISAPYADAVIVLEKLLLKQFMLA